MMSSAKAKYLQDEAPKADLDFIDFGCGAGKSIAFARSIAGGEGFGIDLSEEAVSECWASGLPAERGDLLAFEAKNAAAVTTAVDLMPEIGDKLDFEKGISHLVIAARNYAVIQHNFYDADTAFALSGAGNMAHFSKRIRFKPYIGDYIVLLQRLAASHAISGFALFGIGEPRLVSLDQTDAVPSPMVEGAFRTLRVVIGRKEVERFRIGLRKAGTGEQLFVWERPTAV